MADFCPQELNGCPEVEQDISGTCVKGDLTVESGECRKNSYKSAVCSFEGTNVGPASALSTLTMRSESELRCLAQMAGVCDAVRTSLFFWRASARTRLMLLSGPAGWWSNPEGIRDL